MVFEQEAAFETALINLLTEKYGWEPEILRYKTEEDLIQNWKQILFENNRDVDRLNDVPLTDGEMQQILDQITRLRTPLKLNGFINGKTVAVKRDNPADELHFGKEVSLKIYDRQEIAAGQSRYQIAEQPVFKARNSVLPNRRGDFMLLINGMPLIHCELKRSGVDVSQATNQIEKYAHEGVFTGLFALVQIFIAMQPDETVYFANPGPDGKFNKDFYFHWADANNEPLNNWKDIAQYLLSIPMAHQLIGFYTVADDTDGILKVMRSYQYYATSRITSRVAMRRWADRDQMGGYIWHTTGSGKTLTSFKSAQLIAASKDADKVVFLMDRVELGTQSLLDYRGFADDTDSVQATENTDILVAKLRSDDPANTLIVTSIQKMSRVEEENGFNAHDIELIQNKRVVFIIDEAHRDVFGEMLRTIKETFPNAMFFGFTGTPIHDENQKKMSTTSDVFGNELHRYSIADGIRDKNVLGFDPYMVPTYKDRDLRKAVALERAKATTEAEALADPKKKKVYLHYMDHTKVPMAGYVQADGSYLKGIEDYLPVSQYEREEHISEGPEGIILEAMLEGYAEFYSAELSEKIHRGQKENALKGKNNGGGVPLGYLLDKKAQKLVIDPTTAPLVVEVFEKYADGKSVRSIVEDFNARGLKTKRGQPFNINSFSSLLKNRKYIGEYRYQDVVIEGGVPAIVPEDLFNRVQERMEKNRHAPAMAKAKEDYLLTTKLFCGKCERMMVGESGKSHTGAMHYYYKCSGAKRLKDCDKKAVRKDWIERVVVRLTMQRVMDEEKINRLIDAILVMQEQEDTTTPALRSQLAETESSIGNILKAIEQGIFTPSTKQRLDELEARKEEILVNIQTAELQKPKLTREQMTAWFEQFRHGDPANRDFQKRLIDTFVNAVYVFDDKLVLTYNYQHGTQTISLDEIASALSSDFDGATPPRKETSDRMSLFHFKNFRISAGRSRICFSFSFAQSCLWDWRSDSMKAQRKTGFGKGETICGFLRSYIAHIYYCLAGS